VRRVLFADDVRLNDGPAQADAAASVHAPSGAAPPPHHQHHPHHQQHQPPSAAATMADVRRLSLPASASFRTSSLRLQQAMAGAWVFALMSAVRSLTVPSDGHAPAVHDRGKPVGGGSCGGPSCGHAAAAAAAWTSA
jgi:hypothetical protein